MLAHDRDRVSTAVWLVGLLLAGALLNAVAVIHHARSEQMRASWYDEGPRTATGERFRPNGLTAAHRTLPFGTKLHVCRGGRCVTVRVNDRGPAKYTGRNLDLSRGAAQQIGMLGVGVATVSAEVLR